MSTWILLLVVIAVVGAMVPNGNRRKGSAKAKGRAGENSVILMKKLFLDSKIYIDINDVTLQTPTGTTQIDHIIVSKFGIFVVETKNMSGWIFGSPSQSNWTQSLPGGKKFRFQNPLHQNYKHTKTLETFLGIDHDFIHSVVMFVGETKFKTPMPANVMDSGFISYIKSKTNILFSDYEVERMVLAIRNGMMPKSEQTRREHVESLNAKHHRNIH